MSPVKSDSLCFCAGCTNVRPTAWLTVRSVYCYNTSDEVHASHSFQSDSSVSRFGIVGFNDAIEFSPWHKFAHARQNSVLWVILWYALNLPVASVCCLTPGSLSVNGPSPIRMRALSRGLVQRFFSGFLKIYFGVSRYPID